MLGNLSRIVILVCANLHVPLTIIPHGRKHLSNSRNTDAQSADTPARVQLLEVDQDSEEQRLDNFLISLLKGVPKTRVYRLIRKGEVRVNKKRAKPETRLHVGDIVRVPPIRMAERAANIPGIALVKTINESILLEDENLIVLNKPQGLAVHAGSGQQLGLIEALRWIRSESADQKVYLELAHRIDKETTGCVIIAKNRITLNHLQHEFKARNVEKCYWAIVHGEWPAQAESINVPLLKIILSAGEKVVTVSPEGKQARTEFRVLRRFKSASLLEARPLTGRMHQIRVHCQHAGHPIIGDKRYTYDSMNRFPHIKLLCLHAASVAFQMPHGIGLIKVNAPLQGSIKRLLDELDNKPERL
jgi:23S rRNA pseudouridine955/2504/2580 synthase